jgi:RNA polymerase sigma factor (TIGR02999 family)
MPAPMPSEPAGDITEALAQLRAGDRSALDRLMDLVYEDLRRRAHWQLGAGQGTMSTTALVHETFLRLAAASRRDWENRLHFFNVAAKSMRQIVIDHARNRAAQKRGGNAVHVEADERIAERVRAEADELLAIDAALDRLEAVDERLARTVELHFFGGLSMAEVADALGVAPRTAKRDWQKARGLLRQFLAGGGDPG